VRQIRTGQHEVAGRKIADEVADEIAASRRDDLVEFELRMEVPAHRPVRVAVLPRLERFRTPDLDEF